MGSLVELDFDVFESEYLFYVVNLFVFYIVFEFVMNV